MLGRAWGSPGRRRGSLDVPRGVLGALLGCRNHSNTLGFIVFSGMGFPVAVVSSFFTFPIVCTTVFFNFQSFFRFSDRIHDRFSVFTCLFLFCFYRRFFLHERIHGRDSAPRGSVLSGTQGPRGVPGRASRCLEIIKTFVFLLFSAMRSTLGVPCGRCFCIF